ILERPSGSSACHSVHRLWLSRTRLNGFTKMDMCDANEFQNHGRSVTRKALPLVIATVLPAQERSCILEIDYLASPVFGLDRQIPVDDLQSGDRGISGA